MRITKHTSSPSPRETAGLTTEQLREQFLLQGLFKPGQLELRVTDLDRAIVGGACPQAGRPLELGAVEMLRTPAFLDRRELGILNVGAAVGTVRVGEERFTVAPRECVYAGREAGTVEFSAAEGDAPVFLLVSYPAHTAYPARKVGLEDANIIELGSPQDANERVLYQYIYEGGVESCQLVMGYTELKPGSVWNTMPAHTHDRRTEIYCYFDVPEGHAVLHMMGQPGETRPLWVHNQEAILSPSWSIHCGAGTNNYRFVWAMGGENQAFADMDGVAINDLR